MDLLRHRTPAAFLSWSSLRPRMPIPLFWRCVGHRVTKEFWGYFEYSPNVIAPCSASRPYLVGFSTFATERIIVVNLPAQNRGLWRGLPFLLAASFSHCHFARDLTIVVC